MRYSPERLYRYSTRVFNVVRYSFLTARELVSKSRDGAGFKKSTRKSRVTSTTAIWYVFLFLNFISKHMS